MAKTLYPLAPIGTVFHRGDNSARLNGTASFWWAQILSEARGADTTGTVLNSANTVTGPTPGVEIVLSGSVIEWISDPLSADFTISGTITFNIWAKESATGANAAINAVIDKIDGATGAITQIVKSARVTELTTTSVAVNFTATPTSTACKRGDRLRLRFFGSDAGTMGSGSTVTVNYDRSSAGVLGDTYVTFTENLTFENATPAGSTYYLTDTASAVNPGAANEKAASTTRGGEPVNSVTNTATGPTSGIQITDSAGGTALEWYTPPLDAVSLGGKAKLNIRALESNAAANASLRAEVAIVNNDGSGAAVWGIACIGSSTNGELPIADTAVVAFPSGDDTAVTAGQRLRFRVYLDDSSTALIATGQTVTVSYSGATPSAAGDTYVILPVTVTEQSSGSTYTKAGYARESA